MNEFLGTRINDLLPKHLSFPGETKAPGVQPDVGAKLNSQEFQEVLPKAVREVSMLYLVDLDGSLAPTQTRDPSEKYKDRVWNNAAQEFPVFSGRILELRERLKVVAETEKAYSPGIGKNTLLGFMEIKDKTAALLLGDILLSRTIKYKGYLDYDLLPWEEAELMASEMGLREDLGKAWESEQARSTTLEQVVEKVLRGDLRITYQPKSKTLQKKKL